MFTVNCFLFIEDLVYESFVGSDGIRNLDRKQQKNSLIMILRCVPWFRVYGLSNDYKVRITYKSMVDVNE